MTRHIWQPHEVSDARAAASDLRNGLERRDVRRCLEHAARDRPIRAACEVGCGYGRLTSVLSEFAPRVVGFEREAELLRAARRLSPGVDWVRVSALTALPAASGSFDFAMTFTVLQHLNDVTARQAVEELQRIAAGGFVLLVEETDSSLGAGLDPDSLEAMTRGRAVATYRSWIAPWALCLCFPREIEPGYPRADVGAYMLFTASAGRRP